MIQFPIDTQILQADLDFYSSWTIQNKLPLNIDKCKVIYTSPHATTYRIDTSELQQVTCERDLGILIQSSLSVSATCSQASKRALSVLGLLRRAMGAFEPEIFITLLNSYIRPHLEYAIQAWNPWLRKDQLALELPQRRATKLVRGLWFRPYNERLRLLKTPSTLYRRTRSDLIFTYKVLNTPNHPCRGLYNLSRSLHLRGHALKLQLARCRLNCRKYFLSQRVVKTWNALPQRVVLAKNVHYFKAYVDDYLKNKHFELP